MDSAGFSDASPAPSPGASVCLLVPRPLQRALSFSSSSSSFSPFSSSSSSSSFPPSVELVCERRAAGRRRFLLRVADASSRADISSARAALFSDARLRAYLPAADALSWPPPAALCAAAAAAAAARETDAPPDFSAAAALRRAARLVADAAEAPALFALRRVAGNAGTLGAGKLSAGELALFRGDERDESRGPRGVFVAEPVDAPPVTHDAVTRLRLTGDAAAAAARLFRDKAAGAEEWAEIARVHTQCTAARRLGLFHSAESFVTLIGAKSHIAARRVADAAAVGQRVRLRVGVFLTVVQRLEVFVVRGGGTDNFAEAFVTATGRRADECAASGDLLRVAPDANAEAVEDALRERFLGPLAEPHTCADLGSGILRVTVPKNPFGIVYGPRVVGGAFPENAEARAELSELIAAREGAEPAREDARRPPSALPPAEPPAIGAAVASATVTGEQLRRGVDEALIQVLAQEPMTKAGIAAHEEMARFRVVQNFDAVLKDALRRHTEYQVESEAMAHGARSRRSVRPAVKQRHAVRRAATEVDPVLVERYRTTRQPVKKSELFAQLREQTKDAKRVRREERERERKALKDRAPAKAVPKTKERMRREDTTIVENPNDAEILRDEADDEFAAYYNEGRKPAVLITTSARPSFRTKQFVKEALWLFPNSIYRPRKDYTVKEITQYCINREFTDLIVVTERLKEPHGMIISHLPEGPTATFRVSNFLTHAQLNDPAPRTEHYPELIFKNFDTRLGRRVHRMLECLFPATRDYEGRAVATFHNQRDYIFLRTHRYIFDSLDAVRIQEMGPRFTLRLLSVQLGVFDAQFGEYEWFRKKEHDADKLEWYL